MSIRRGSDLNSQALRLSRRARDRISMLATELLAPGSVTTAAQAARGLCLLALELARGVVYGYSVTTLRSSSSS